MLGDWKANVSAKGREVFYLLLQFLRRVNRSYIAFIHDTFMAFLCLPLSLLLRVSEESFSDFSFKALFLNTAAFTFLAIGSFFITRLYRGVWRHFSFLEMIRIIKSATLTCVLYAPLMLFLNHHVVWPRSLPVINWFILVSLLAGSRFLYALAKGHLARRRSFQAGHRQTPALLVGADSLAEAFLHEMAHHPTAPYKILGIIEDGGGDKGRRVHGVEILGSIGDLAWIIEKFAKRRQKPELLIIAKEDLDPSFVRSLLEASDYLNLSLLKLPELARGKKRDGFELKPIALEDLLGRPQTDLPQEQAAILIEGKRVLITGAGGSIGSELVRQIATLNPAEIFLFDSSEYLLYTIDLELSERFSHIKRQAILGNIADKINVQKTLLKYKPEIVFHAAALKHVPLVEQNPEEGILTNVLGTRYLAESCRQNGVEVMVLISTDKAINPTSIMGATKRLAEMYCQALELTQTNTRFITVRFGNVLGSTGSIVPLFQKQLAKGGPLTVTHPDMVRYFMTIKEASQLVIQAAAFGSHLKNYGKIYVLDMGEPMRILDLAKNMIRLAGFHPGKNIQITFTGLRPGEKLFEELFHKGEIVSETPHKKIMVAAPRTVDYAFLCQALDELAVVIKQRQKDHALKLLHYLVPEYSAHPGEEKILMPDRGGVHKA